MDKRSCKASTKYETDPFHSLLACQRNSQQYAGGKNSCRYKRILNRSEKSNENLKGGVGVPITSLKKPYLQKVDADTFRLLPDNNIPKNSSRNALNLTCQSFHFHEKANQDRIYSHTSKTLQIQTSCRPEDQQPPQTLINNSKPLHEILIPKASLQLKGFISVTSDQMEKYLQVIGMYTFNLQCFHAS